MKTPFLIFVIRILQVILFKVVKNCSIKRDDKTNKIPKSRNIILPTIENLSSIYRVSKATNGKISEKKFILKSQNSHEKFVLTYIKNFENFSGSSQF